MMFWKTKYPCSLSFFLLLHLFFVFEVQTVTFVSSCPKVCRYRGSSNSMICTDVRYPRLPHILHCLNKNPLIREIGLSTVHFNCNCAWIKFLKTMRSRNIHVLPPRLTVTCYNTPREKCDHAFLNDYPPVKRFKRQDDEVGGELESDDFASDEEIVNDVATEGGAGNDAGGGGDSVDNGSSPAGAGGDVLGAGDNDDGENSEKGNVKTLVSQEESVSEEGIGKTTGSGEEYVDKLQDDQLTPSNNESAPYSQDNEAEVLVLTSSSRHVVMEFGITAGLICLSAAIIACVWLAYQTKRQEPPEDNTLLEVIMHPNRYQHSHACLRPKAAPYQLTPIPPDGAGMEVHWVQATVPLKMGGIQGHYP